VPCGRRRVAEKPDIDRWVRHPQFHGDESNREQHAGSDQNGAGRHRHATDRRPIPITLACRCAGSDNLINAGATGTPPSRRRP
jgi:hypothetical protein